MAHRAREPGVYVGRPKFEFQTLSKKMGMEVGGLWLHIVHQPTLSSVKGCISWK